MPWLDVYRLGTLCALSHPLNLEALNSPLLPPRMCIAVPCCLYKAGSPRSPPRCRGCNLPVLGDIPPCNDRHIPKDNVQSSQGYAAAVGQLERLDDVEYQISKQLGVKVPKQKGDEGLLGDYIRQQRQNQWQRVARDVTRSSQGSNPTSSLLFSVTRCNSGVRIERGWGRGRRR